MEQFKSRRERIEYAQAAVMELNEEQLKWALEQLEKDTVEVVSLANAVGLQMFGIQTV